MPPMNIEPDFEIYHVQSLTAMLKATSLPFSVQLRFLGDSVLVADEMEFSGGLQAGDAVFAREVLLCLADKAVVSARSVCRADDAYWRDVLDCGTTSLGAQLFGGAMNHLQRTPFVFCRLPEDHLLTADIVDISCVARRSAFDTPNGARLLLTECFLPTVYDYAA